MMSSADCKLKARVLTAVGPLLLAETVKMGWSTGRVLLLMTSNQRDGKSATAQMLAHRARDI